MQNVVLDIYFNINAIITTTEKKSSEDYGNEVQDQINLFFESLELRSTGDTVSFC